MFKRIGLFLLTNIMVVVTIGIAWSILSAFFNLGAINSNMFSLLIFCSLFGMAGAFISLLLSKFMAKTMMGVQIIDPSTPDPTLRHLVLRVHEISQRAGLSKMPEVGFYESGDVNAFATGPSRSNSLVAVSTGLLQRMNDHEVDGVLAHEVSHIANGDMVTMTLIAGIVNTFAMFFSRVLANIIASNVEERYRGFVHFICVMIGDILFTLLGSIVVNIFSRAREYRADKGGATYSSRENMIAALRRLQSLASTPAQDNDPEAFATLKISHSSREGLASLFMTHPSLEDRIAALENGPRG